MQTAAIVCREFGWTIDQYENQPADFIDTIILMFKAEADSAKKQNKR